MSGMELNATLDALSSEVWSNGAFPPPYHPELQPIERIWVVAKVHLGKSVPTSMADLEVKLRHALTEVVTSDTWVGSWRRI